MKRVAILNRPARLVFVGLLTLTASCADSMTGARAPNDTSGAVSFGGAIEPFAQQVTIEYAPLPRPMRLRAEVSAKLRNGNQTRAIDVTLVGIIAIARSAPDELAWNATDFQIQTTVDGRNSGSVPPVSLRFLTSRQGKISKVIEARVSGNGAAQLTDEQLKEMEKQLQTSNWVLVDHPVATGDELFESESVSNAYGALASLGVEDLDAASRVLGKTVLHGREALVAQITIRSSADTNGATISGAGYAVVDIATGVTIGAKIFANAEVRVNDVPYHLKMNATTESEF